MTVEIGRKIRALIKKRRRKTRLEKREKREDPHLSDEKAHMGKETRALPAAP